MMNQHRNADVELLRFQQHARYWLTYLKGSKSSGISPLIAFWTATHLCPKRRLSNAYNVSRTMPPKLSVKSRSTITSLQFWRNFTGCRSRLGLNINFSPLLSNVSMIKPQHICLNLFFAMFPPVLVSALWTISLYLYRKLFPGLTRAQQIVLFLCLPLNCGTRFLLK